MVRAARWKCRTPIIAKNSPSRHRRTTLSGYIFATRACIRQSEKHLLSSNISSTCPHNMVNFDPLAAEIGSVVWAPLQISTGSRLGSVTARNSSNGRQPNFAALNRGRHLYSPIFGRAATTLAHISRFCVSFPLKTYQTDHHQIFRVGRHVAVDV